MAPLGRLRRRFGQISKQGNLLLRFLLIEAARTTIWDEQKPRRFYFHIQSRKNPPSPVARKLVLRLFLMLFALRAFWARAGRSEGSVVRL